MKTMLRFLFALLAAVFSACSNQDPGIGLGESIVRQVENEKSNELDLRVIAAGMRWDKFCAFGPYSGYDAMVREIGFDVPELRNDRIERSESEYLVLLFSGRMLMRSAYIDRSSVIFIPAPSSCVSSANAILPIDRTGSPNIPPGVVIGPR